MQKPTVIVGIGIAAAGTIFIGLAIQSYLDYLTCLSVPLRGVGSGTPLVCFNRSILQFEVGTPIAATGIFLLVLGLKDFSLASMSRTQS